MNSGSPIASFLLGAVDNANATFRAVNSSYPRQHAWIVHAGDTWRVNDTLTVDYGLRWDYFSPSSEKYDRFSFFDQGRRESRGRRSSRSARICRRQLWRGELSRPLSGEELVRRGLHRALGVVYRE